MRARLRRDTAAKTPIAADAWSWRTCSTSSTTSIAPSTPRRAAGAAAAIVQGIELVRSQFLAQVRGARRDAIRLARPAVRSPDRHEAATTVPVPDPAQDGIVVGVIREGYAIGADVLRPAMVAVGQFTTKEQLHDRQIDRGGIRRGARRAGGLRDTRRWHRARPPPRRAWTRRNTARRRRAPVIDVYTLTNKNGMVAKVITYGALLTELHVPDRDGKLARRRAGFPEARAVPW